MHTSFRGHDLLKLFSVMGSWSSQVMAAFAVPSGTIWHAREVGLAWAAFWARLALPLQLPMLLQGTHMLQVHSSRGGSSSSTHLSSAGTWRAWHWPPAAHAWPRLSAWQGAHTCGCSPGPGGPAGLLRLPGGGQAAGQADSPQPRVLLNWGAEESVPAGLLRPSTGRLASRCSWRGPEACRHRAEFLVPAAQLWLPGGSGLVGKQTSLGQEGQTNFEHSTQCLQPAMGWMQSYRRQSQSDI